MTIKRKKGKQWKSNKMKTEVWVLANDMIIWVLINDMIIWDNKIDLGYSLKINSNYG